MYFNYVGTKVHYKFSKKSKGDVLVLLHGWQASMESFNMLEELKKKYRVLQVDFPPFGKSPEPIGWNVFSYANMIISLCENLGINKCHVLGHSFGGRVAILMGVIQPRLVEKIVLVDGAGMKPKRKISYYLKKAKFNVKKIFHKDTSRMGSLDYRQLSDNMKKTFSSIVSTHLEEYALMVKQPTLIVFGEDDKETPIYMAQRLNKLIGDSKLVVLKGCGHFCFLEKPREFCKIVTKFLRE